MRNPQFYVSGKKPMQRNKIIRRKRDSFDIHGTAKPWFYIQVSHNFAFQDPLHNDDTAVHVSRFMQLLFK